MRVLLIYPNANTELIGYGDMGAIAEPIALEYIGAAARDEGHDVRILDLRLHINDLDSTLESFQPEVVGVTGYSMHVLRNLQVCRRAKELVPSCTTVVGGHHATLEAVDYFEPQIDCVVIGEGTFPFRQMLRRIAGGHPVAGIPGVWSRVQGEFTYGGTPPPFDINQIPRPDRQLTREDRHRYYIDWMSPIALMRTSVGCPYRCSFCALWRIMDGRYYKRDVDRVVEELKEIPERYVFLVDDEPFVNPQRMTEMAEGIAAAGIEKEYFSYCRIDSLLRDLDLMKQWRDIGLRRLFIGVETIFDHELKDYNKRQQQRDIIRALETARELGIHLLCNFIIHPSYTEQEFQQVIQFIRTHQVEYPSFTVWTPIPGTGQTYEDVQLRQPNGRPHWEYFDLQHPVIETRLPLQEFRRQYDQLHETFSSNYFEWRSPLMVADFARRQAILRAIAAKVLGGSTTAPLPGC